MDNAHEFALYGDDLSESVRDKAVDQTIVIDEASLVHRITQILRLKPGEHIILFDRANHVRVQLKTIHRNKSIEVILLEKNTNKILVPSITVLLPVLKRDALEQAITTLSALGVTEIQLIQTKKTHQALLSKAHIQRLIRIVQSAAEQSKYFAMPDVRPVMLLEHALKNINKTGICLCADVQGSPIETVLAQKKRENKQSVVLLVGPEGGLTADEQEHVLQAGFTFCVLTPTVLESWLAVTLLAGICRSYLQ